MRKRGEICGFKLVTQCRANPKKPVGIRCAVLAREGWIPVHQIRAWFKNNINWPWWVSWNHNCSAWHVLICWALGYQIRFDSEQWVCDCCKIVRTILRWTGYDVACSQQCDCGWPHHKWLIINLWNITWTVNGAVVVNLNLKICRAASASSWRCPCVSGCACYSVYINDFIPLLVRYCTIVFWGL